MPSLDRNTGALWRPRGWEPERQYSRSFSRSTSTLCGGCSIRLASPARPQAASPRIALMQHAIPTLTLPRKRGRVRVEAPRQPDREFGEFTDPAVDDDRSAMLLGDDVPADRQAEPGALAGRLGREEWLEQLFPELGRDAGAVVAHTDFDLIAEIPGRDLQHRPEAVRRLAPTLIGCVNRCRTGSKRPA